VTWVGDDEGGSVGELVGATAARRSLRDEYGEVEYGDMEYRG
jgi:hypothetical protein